MAFNIGDAFFLRDGVTVQDTFSSPAVLLTLIVKNIYVIAGIILFFFIIAGGLGIILNAGNPDKQKQGSKTLGSAVAGFVILFASYWIIRIIEALTKVQILGTTP
ncbi:MAG: hypothetical protein ABIJ43_00475 [Candidatus Beckwithbacteria bacterium]|nr:hypothetical protein [Patescibacteria group bacterium]